MRVVLDTNVVVSGLPFGGVPGRILTAWTSGAFVLVLSPPVLDEYRRVGRELAKGRAPLNAALDALLALVAVRATMIDAPRLAAPVSADPDADMFFAAAIAGENEIGDSARIRRRVNFMNSLHCHRIVPNCLFPATRSGQLMVLRPRP